jgi:hypothetical protein
VHRLVALLAIALSSMACSGASAPSESEPDPAATSGADARAHDDGTATETTSEAAPACPPRFGMQGISCEGVSLSCEYPEGSCYCGQPRRCSGVPPPPLPPMWVCEAHEPPCPTAGTPCEGSATCAPWCCGVGVACVDGTWQMRAFPCPP